MLLLPSQRRRKQGEAGALVTSTTALRVPKDQSLREHGRNRMYAGLHESGQGRILCILGVISWRGVGVSEGRVAHFVRLRVGVDGSSCMSRES